MSAYVVCTVADTSYAIPAQDVEQLEMIEEITRVPDSPPFLEGVVSLRGRVVPVVSLRLRFGLPAIAYDISSRLVVVRLERRLVALAVDSAREYRSFEPSALQPPPDTLLGYQNECLAGVFHQEKRLILVLDVARLLSASALPPENDRSTDGP